MENTDQLIEFKEVPQDEKGIIKRKFFNKKNDLTVWYDLDNTVVGFQLTIDEIVITHISGHLSLNTLDSSEKDNYTPILVGSPKINLRKVIEYIEINGTAIDKEIIDHIKTVLIKHT